MLYSDLEVMEIYLDPERHDRLPDEERASLEEQIDELARKGWVLGRGPQRERYFSYRPEEDERRTSPQGGKSTQQIRQELFAQLEFNAAILQGWSSQPNEEYRQHVRELIEAIIDLGKVDGIPTRYERVGE